MAGPRRLAANIVSGVFVNIVRIAIQIVMLPLMARLLGPGELGLYAMAMPLVGFVLLLAEAGLGDSLAREKSKDSLVWSSAFWGLLTISSALAIGVYLSSFIFAHIANQPRLPLIMLPLSATVIMLAATVIPNALMLREGNMVPSSVGDLAGNVLGAVLGMYMAISGFGVWAMVAQYTTIYFVRMVVFNIAKPFVPKFEFSLKSLFSHTGMGGIILGSRILDLGVKMIENSQVSRKLGSAQLGNYSYSNQIGYLVSNTIGNPLWANLYYVAINKPSDEVAAHYIHTHRIFSVLVFPVAVLLAVGMPIIIPVFLGANWSHSIYPIMILIVLLPFGNMGAFQSAILFARNRGGLVMVGLVIAAVLRVLTVMFGYRYGILGLSIGLGINSILYYMYTVIYISPIIGNSRREVLGVSRGPIVASVVAGVCMYFLLKQFNGLIWLMCAGAISLVPYIATLLIIDSRRFKADIDILLRLLRLKSAVAQQ